MPFSFECPYCGELISGLEDLEYIRAYKLCPECETTFDDDELEEWLPDEDLLEDEDVEYGIGEGDDDDDEEEESSDPGFDDADDTIVDDDDDDDESVDEDEDAAD